jgi:hypothetical protein
MQHFIKQQNKKCPRNSGHSSHIFIKLYQKVALDFLPTQIGHPLPVFLFEIVETHS